eukprot:TRINITY_DN5830_c0_g1_i1.p1 TRINITY_DN5830_c0_g1~~TRINITY_DN5830_c0_g1_i1.p1  ORF type:complete len:625 (+),score=124.07 TRINITY_DN5830_c0_g1_i1:123-1997(+)
MWWLPGPHLSRRMATERSTSRGECRYFQNKSAIDELREVLRVKFGTLVRAWRVAFDVEANGLIDMRQFDASLKRICVVANVRSMWGNLDTKQAGMISLADLDEAAAEILEDFRIRCVSIFGSMKEAWEQCLDIHNSGSVTLSYFLSAAPQLGYSEAEADQLFDLFRLRPGQTFLKPHDVFFVQKWEERRQVLMSRAWRLKSQWVNKDPYFNHGTELDERAKTPSRQTSVRSETPDVRGPLSPTSPHRLGPDARDSPWPTCDVNVDLEAANVHSGSRAQTPLTARSATPLGQESRLPIRKFQPVEDVAEPAAGANMPDMLALATRSRASVMLMADSRITGPNSAQWAARRLTAVKAQSTPRGAPKEPLLSFPPSAASSARQSPMPLPSPSEKGEGRLSLLEQQPSADAKLRGKAQGARSQIAEFERPVSVVSCVTSVSNPDEEFVATDRKKAWENLRAFLLKRYGCLCKAYDTMDDNGNGYVTQDEWVNYLTRVERYCRPSEALRLFESATGEGYLAGTFANAIRIDANGAQHQNVTWHNFGITVQEWQRHLREKQMKRQAVVKERWEVSRGARKQCAAKDHERRIKTPNGNRPELPFCTHPPRGWGQLPPFERGGSLLRPVACA